MNKEKQELINLSLAQSSWKSYNTAIDSFENFRRKFHLPSIWPAPIDHITHFIAFLSYRGLAASTVSSYISGLSHRHKMNDYIDSTKSFIVSKMIEGIKRKKPQKPDIRCPISIELLKKIILSLRYVCSSQYEAGMFSAAFSLAFFAMLRVSEITINSKLDNNSHALNYEDIQVDSVNNPTELRVKISSSKTDQTGKSVTLLLNKQTDPIICPLQLITFYFKVRPSGINVSKKLFTHFNGDAITRYQFCTILQKCVKFCEVPSHIRSHSFRIGRASDLAKNNVSEERIKTCGRWTSSSYLRYIRL